MIPGWEDATPQEQANEMRRLFRKVFNTPEGKVVFGILMEDLKMFAISDTQEDMILSKYASFLIRERLGIKQTVEISNFIVETAANGRG